MNKPPDTAPMELCIQIDAKEILCRFIEELTGQKRPDGATIEEAIGGAPMEQGALEDLFDLAKIAAHYFGEVVMAGFAATGAEVHHFSGDIGPPDGKYDA